MLHPVLYRYIFIILLFVFFDAQSQDQSTIYKDGHGGTIHIPSGHKAFADEVISFTEGKPAAIDIASDPSKALATPDFNGEDKGFVALGCGGALVLKFTDNALVDIDGPDLYVFELGKFFEPTDLAISKDGITWITIGEINGATAQVDIEKFTKPGDIYNYIRLTDLKTECRGKWPGADIDAVAAIGSARKHLFTGNVLFNFNESILKPEAKEILNLLAKEIIEEKVTEIIVQGYTDNIGSEDFNQKLSIDRAIAVKNYLDKKLSDKRYKIEAQGLGESNPSFTNETKEGQEKNRRVEILLLPSKKQNKVQ